MFVTGGGAASWRVWCRHAARLAGVLDDSVAGSVTGFGAVAGAVLVAMTVPVAVPIAMTVLVAVAVSVTVPVAIAVGVPIPVFTPEPGGRWFGGVSASCGVGEDQFTGSSGVVVGVGEAPAALVDDVVVR